MGTSLSRGKKKTYSNVNLLGLAKSHWFHKTFLVLTSPCYPSWVKQVFPEKAVCELIEAMNEKKRWQGGGGKRERQKDKQKWWLLVMQVENYQQHNFMADSLLTSFTVSRQKSAVKFPSKIGHHA